MRRRVVLSTRFGLALGLTATAAPSVSPSTALASEPTTIAAEDPPLVPAAMVEAGVEAADAFAPSELGPGVEDPRKRKAPRTHRFRLGLQMDYVRLSAAQDESGYVQRFHYLPIQLDFAYQVQLLKYFMLRPSLALGANPANTLESMPAVVHPQIFGGYQGNAIGAALGYGYLHPFPAVKDLISNTRGGLGQPIITANHAVRVELSYTTRVDRGALSFAVRLGGLKSHIQHYELDQRSWRFFSGINFGWYFGDGHKSREREQERAERRRERKRRA
ncbi:hypothetical protein [Paraliomyxa miuraensis]|uniref:hypothetical protein n=1 Tax=Paraliomyxa miuraensis TaxID=376150 RepID=UPI00225B319A|nr:hypothetical protein [Paraliomyxa miuraensis]MCX4244735.1 hypothetical protein [Paraliomyxa miuraensis]